MQQYSVKRGATDREIFKELLSSAKKTITQSPYLYAVLFLGATAFSYYKIVIKSPSYQTTFYGDSLYITFLTVGRILAHYMHLLLYPVNLNADYSLNAFPLSSSLFESSSFLSLLLLIGIAYLCLRLLGRDKLMAFGIIGIKIDRVQQ